MRFFLALGLDSIAWSLRRLYCPVSKDALVLDVGSGGNPYFRANVLCDAYVESQERYFAPLIADRPTVLSLAEELPFKDDAFDFVIASHTLEHSADPEKFISEIQRVGKAGYIETPDAIMERLTHYTFHRLEVTERNGVLVIRKKKSYVQDEELAELFDHRAIAVFPKLVSRYPFDFHVRYYWRKGNGGIKYRIVNSGYKFDWEIPATDRSSTKTFKIIPAAKKLTLSLVRKLLSQNSRNRQLDVVELMRCGRCASDKLKLNREQENVTCAVCGKKYPVYCFNN